MPKQADLREQLLARRRELLDRVQSIETNFRREEEPLEKDAEEQSLQIENDEVLKALDEASRKELASVERAIERMESGEYGICTRCGESIAPARLRALPAAELCIRCAEKAGRS
ncbi:MAG TPA: TraR/DksA family transcriptional regulator [Vicinamibacteria bacterium]|nr:TraR/DksA family transcriptional regulator [Vicinamibacteria bacterium]